MGTKAYAKDLKIGWDVTGATTWKAFPIIPDVPLLYPKRRLEEAHPPGFIEPISVYTDIEPTDKDLEMWLGTFSFLARACGSDKFTTPLHLLVDEITPDAAAQFGIDGVKLMDIAVDDASVMRYKLTKVMVKKVAMKMVYGKPATMTVTLGIPGITIGDPGGTDVAMDVANTIHSQDCFVYVGANLIECASCTVTIEPIVHVGGAVGLEEQVNWYISGAKYSVEFEGLYESAVHALDGTYKGNIEFDMDVYFGAPPNAAAGDDPAAAATHWCHFNFDDLEEQSSECTFKGNEMVMLKKAMITGKASKVKITCEDALFGVAQYW